MNIKRRITAIGLICSLMVLIFGGGRSPTTVFADSINHTHIWATTYDSANHWEYCTVCGEKRNVTAHTFTDHWHLGYESCGYQNYSLRTCSCGYSYTYHKPHQSGEYWSYSIPRGWHWKICKVCGSWTTSGECVDANKKRLTCKNPGTCVVCGRTRTSGYHFLVNGKCRDCGKIFFIYTKPKVNYNSDYSGCVVTFSITPVDSQAYLTGEYGDYTSGVYKSGATSIKRLQDGTIEYTRTYTFNPLINSKISSTVGNNEVMVKINGYNTWTESFGISWTVWQDHQTPVQNDVIQKDQASANGWATIKQLTLSGTENLSDIVYLTVSDKTTGEKYVTDAAVPVTDGKYSYTCTPSIEGDANGRTYVVTAKDRIGNTSTKEFIVSKTDGSAPQLKSGTPLTYTDWSTSKNISLSFFDFGAGGVEASFDNQTDYKALTKSGEYYIWNHSFGNQVGTTEHTIYVRDALGNAGSYKFTVGNTDSTNYTISYNLNGGLLSGQKTSYTVADSFTLPTPTKTGYTFTGWTGSNGTTPQKTVTVNKGTRGNLSYTAHFEKTVTATFKYYNNQTATVTGKIIDSATSVAVKAPAASGTPSGYTFRGWSTSPAANASVNAAASASVTISGNVTYYASYSKSVTAAFYYCTLAVDNWTYVNGAQKGATASATQYLGYTGAVINSNIAIPSAVTASHGGASAENYAGVSKDTNSASTTTPTTACTKYYAVYTEPLKFYYYNGTADASTSVTRYMLSNGSTYLNSLSTSAPAPAAYDGAAFAWWSYESGVSSSSFLRKPLETGVNSLYAVYKKNVSISYNTNGGSGAPAAQSGIKYYAKKESGSNITNPSITVTELKPSRNGYSFSSWNTSTNGRGATYKAGTAYTVSANVALYAQWQYNPVSVKVPQILTGDHTGKSQFRVKCDDLKTGNIKVTVPNSFPYKQAGKTDVSATITAKSGNNIITPTNKVCVYNITTKNELSAGCWSGSFNIRLTLTKE